MLKITQLVLSLLAGCLLVGCLADAEKSPYDIVPGLWYDDASHYVAGGCMEETNGNRYAITWNLMYHQTEDTILTSGRSLSLFVGMDAVTTNAYELVQYDSTFASFSGKASLKMRGVTGDATSKTGMNSVVPVVPVTPIPAPIIPPQPPEKPKVKISVKVGDTTRVYGNLKLRNGQHLAFNLAMPDSTCP